MRDIKLSRKSLKNEVLRSYQGSIPPSALTHFQWEALDMLIRDLPCLDGNLKVLLQEVVNSRSLTDYFLCQRFGDPQLYGSPEAYFASVSVLSFLKKYPFGKVSTLDPMEKAVKNFYRAETLCKITNRRLRWFRNRGFRINSKYGQAHSIFHAARLLISKWLGPLDLNTIHDYTRHGPGGAVGVSGDTTTAYYKYAVPRYSVSTKASSYAEAAILSDPLWRRYVATGESIGSNVPSPDECRTSVRSRLEKVNYNKVTFVPKTAQTHRAIAIEPLLNIYLQLGVGDFLTDHLRQFGLNLRSQTKNQNLAKAGSLWDGDASDRPVTLDLSMASDTMAIELVRELLPEDWFNFLSDLRSENGLLEGKEVHWAKFSSMGNGFTFQLESMLFYALSLSVSKHFGYSSEHVSVYGDDIICPAGMALPLIDILNYSGFKVNAEKSFLTGNFRESCGSDWFEGRYVRPFFLKREIKNGKDLVFLLNSFGGLYDPSGSKDLTRNISYDSIRRCIMGRLPKVLGKHLLGPRTEDKEGHVHTPWDLAQKSRLVKWDRDVYAWSYPSVKASSREYSGDVGPLYLQLMGTNSSTDLDYGNRTTRESRKVSLSASYVFEVDREMAPDIKRSVVTRRNSTRLSLATQTCHGWRND